MRLLDLVNGPWAITPDMLGEIQAIYSRHLRGEKIDLDRLRAETGLSFDNRRADDPGYSVQDGVALVTMDGVIAKRMNLMSRISGGVSSELTGQAIERAVADRTVEAVVMAIDSPGGTVDGTPELAAIVRAAGEIKPVLAHTDGTMASAAYWVGSAASRVNISSDVCAVGSIGVVARHVDVSAAEAKSGVKTTEITAGRYKRIAGNYEPLSDAGRAEIQSQVDHIYGAFVDDVAAQRGVSPAEVVERMADGRVFLGQQALAAGLVDGVATLAETMAQAREMARGRRTSALRQPAVTGRQGVTTAQEQNMDIETLKTEHPELVQALRAEASAEAAASQTQAYVDGLAAGAAAEIERIKAVRAQLIPGHEALIESLAFDGVTSGPEAALAIVQAEKDLRLAAGRQIAEEANPPVDCAEQSAGPAVVRRADFDRMSDTERRQALACGCRIVD